MIIFYALSWALCLCGFLSIKEEIYQKCKLSKVEIWTRVWVLSLLPVVNTILGLSIGFANLVEWMSDGDEFY